MEKRVYSSIARAVARRPSIPKGGRGFGYHRPVMTVLVIFVVLSAVEIPILDLIVHRWPVVRVIVLVVGLWGLTWMVGLLCAFLVRPHTVGPDGIQVRSGLEVDIPLRWDDIAAVAVERRVDEPKAPRVMEEGDGRTLLLRMQDETNLVVELERPTPVTLPASKRGGGVQLVSAVRLWADDPRAFMSEVRRHI